MTINTTQHNLLQQRMLQESGATFTRQATLHVTILSLRPGQQPGEVQVELRGDGQCVTVSRPTDSALQLTDDLLSRSQLWSQAEADYEAGHSQDDGEHPTQSKPVSKERLRELLDTVPQTSPGGPSQNGVELSIFPAELHDSHEFYEAYLETPAGCRALQPTSPVDLARQLRRIIPLLAGE